MLLDMKDYDSNSKTRPAGVAIRGLDEELRATAEWIRRSWLMEDLEPPPIEMIIQHVREGRLREPIETRLWEELSRECGRNDGTVTSDVYDDLTAVTWAAPSWQSNFRLSFSDVVAIRRRAKASDHGMASVSDIVSKAVDTKADPVDALIAYGQGH